MKKVYLVIIIMLVIIESCLNNNSLDKLKFPRVMQNEISFHEINKNAFVYYHSGDCSFCYGSILAISKEFPEIPIISISASKNYDLINYYLEQISFTGISLIDSTSLFLQNNQKVLSFYNIFLIDLQYNIIVAAENIDKSSKAKFMRAIAN